MARFDDASYDCWTSTYHQVLAAIPATPGDARVLAVIREQAERISRAG